MSRCEVPRVGRSSSVELPVEQQHQETAVWNTLLAASRMGWPQSDRICTILPFVLWWLMALVRWTVRALEAEDDQMICRVSFSPLWSSWPERRYMSSEVKLHPRVCHHSFYLQQEQAGQLWQPTLNLFRLNGCLGHKMYRPTLIGSSFNGLSGGRCYGSAAMRKCVVRAST